MEKPSPERNTNAINDIRDRIRRLREALDMSQRDLAQEFDVSTGAVAQWESGAREVPGPVIRLVEIYERQLTEPFSSRKTDDSSKVLASSLADEAFRSLNLIGAKAKNGERIRTRFEIALASYLNDFLSGDDFKRRLQVAMIKRLIKSLGEMKGLPVKAVQLVSFLNPDIPDDLRESLTDLQTMTMAISPKRAAQVIEEEFGCSPRKLFLEWSPQPFAIASIGQVHRARLRTGELVAVKVQYPGLLEKLTFNANHLAFIDQLSSLVDSDRAKILHELQTRISEECDYLKEAESHERFHSIFEGDAEIFIPKIYRAYSRKRVLTTEFVEGMGYGEFTAKVSQEKKDWAATVIARFVATSVFQHRVLNADPHSGNYIFSERKVAFIDFGRVIDFEPEAHRHLTLMHFGILINDKATFKKAASCLGICHDRGDEASARELEAIWETSRSLHRNLQEDKTFQITPELVAERRELTKASGRSPSSTLRVNKELFWSIFTNTALWAMRADLRATANWRRNLLTQVTNAVEAWNYLPIRNDS